MALKAVLETLDDVPEAVRGEYEERDGKFFLSVEPGGGLSLEDVSGLKTALSKERTQREGLSRRIAAFGDLDPEKVRADLERLAELSSIDPNAEADKIANSKFETAKSQLIEKHTGELKTRDDRIARLTSTVDDLVRKQVATAAIAEAKGSVDLLLPHVLSATRTRETEDGKYVVEVVDGEKNVRIGDSRGTPMSIKDLVSEMRASDVFGRAFEASGNSGGGKPPNNGGGGGDRGQLKRGTMTQAQKAEFIREKGQEAYLKLPK